VQHARFDTEAFWIPSRAWARAWTEGAPRYWSLVIEDYRERVRDYHSEQFVDEPDAFPLMGPVHLVVVVSLIHAWVFAAATEGPTEVVVDERWEDPTLSALAIQRAPNREEQARTVAGIGPEYELIYDQDMVQDSSDRRHADGSQDPFASQRIRGVWMVGWNIADAHASQLDLRDTLSSALGRRLDRRRLRLLRNELKDLEIATDRPARGLAFEAFIERLLTAHGCKVERGKHRPGEQVDLFVHRPFRALVECRWTTEPVDAPAITLLIGKLTRDRPALVVGLYVSMTGYTDQALPEALQHARDRAVILIDGDDVHALLAGTTHVADLVDERIDALVRRY
jgi:Restriction endonuclease